MLTIFDDNYTRIEIWGRSRHVGHQTAYLLEAHLASYEILSRSLVAICFNKAFNSNTRSLSWAARSFFS